MIRSLTRPVAVLAGAAMILASVFVWSLSGSGEAPLVSGTKGAPLSTLHGSGPIDSPEEVSRREVAEGLDPRATPSDVAPPSAPAPKITVRIVDRAGRPLERGEADPRRRLFLKTRRTPSMDGARLEERPLHLDPGTAHQGLFLTLEAPRGRYRPQEDPHLAPGACWFLDPHQSGATRESLDGAVRVHVESGQALDLVLVPGGTLQGNVLRDRGEAHQVDWVRVRPRGVPAPAPSFARDPMRETPIHEEGTYAFASLDEGLYRVEFLVGNTPVHSIHDVQVRLGEPCTDPRLVNVDLAALLQQVALEVFDEELTPLPSARAVLQVGEDSKTFEPGEHGLRVPLPSAAGSLPTDRLALYVLADGFVPAALDPVPGHRSVVLMPALPVQTQTTEYKADVLSHGYWFRLRRTDAPPGSHWVWATELPFDSDDGSPKALELPGPGRYELEVLTRMRMGSLFGSMAGERYQPTGVFLQVPPGGGLVTIPIPEDLKPYHPESSR